MVRFSVLRPFIVPGALFAGALAVRLVGVDFGLPHMYHWDEHYLAAPIQRFLISGDLLPRMYYYPSAYIYLQFLFTPLSYLLFVLKHGPATPAAMGMADYLLVGRSVTAVVGAAAAVLVYYFAVRIWRDRLAGVIAAVILALSPLQAMDSRFLTTDIAMATTAFLGFFLLSIYLENRTWRALVLAGAALGLAVASKYNAAFFVVAAAAIVAVRDRSWRRPAALVAAASLTFLVLTPGLYLDTHGFLRDTVYVSGHYYVRGNTGERAVFVFWPYINQLWLRTATPGPLLCAAAGLILLVYRNRWRAAAFVLFPAAYVLFLAGVKVYFNRGLEPILPYICLAAGLAAAALVRLLRRGFKPAVAGATAAAFLALLFIRPAVVTTREAGMLAGGDRRTEAKEWFEARVPWPTRVAKEAFNEAPQAEGGQIETPPLDPCKYEVSASAFLVDRPVDDFARAGIVYLLTPNLEGNLELYSRVLPARAGEGRGNYDSVLEGTERVLYLPVPPHDFRPAVEIYRLRDDVLRRNNPPCRGIVFREKWVRSEADPSRRMDRVEGRFALEAPARAGACFTAPAERFRVVAFAEVLAGDPRIVLELDGVEVAARDLSVGGPVETPPLAAPPYYRHLAVRCIGPAGSRARLKSVIVDAAP
ncbi:MAG: glycosyltransferase family 39 protein [Candidatus Zixiibacteriota bacterium]|jgi:hypothetical protein